MVDFAKLAAPFPPSRVSWRVGSTNKDKTKAMALAYIDARDVMERLDEVCGPGGWQCTYPHANGKTVCSIGIKIGDEWVWKANGAGDTDIEAEKGALSDALKRAAVCWGIGRYLYDTAAPWVAIEPAGKSYKIADHEMPRLIKLLGGQAAAIVSATRTEDLGDDGPTESEKRIAAGLKAAIDMAKTWPDLNVWKSAPENVKLFQQLPDALREEVTTYAVKRKEALTPTEQKAA